MTHRRTDWKKIFALAAVFGMAALILAYQYYTAVEQPMLGDRLVLHQQVLAGEAPSPYRYRVLTPWMAEGLVRALDWVFEPDFAFALGFFAFNTVAFSAFFGVLYVYLKQWFSSVWSLGGVLIAALSLTVTFRDHYYQPWSYMETFWFTLGLVLILKRRFGWLAVVTAAASLNRETGVFIPLAYFLVEYPFQRTWDELRRGRLWIDWPLALRTAILGGMSLGVFAGLRLGLGSAEHVVDLRELLRMNLEPGAFSHAMKMFLLFLGPVWVLAVAGWRSAPGFVRRVGWLLPVYGVFYLVWGVWYEVRLLTPLYPILLPPVLSFVCRTVDQKN